MNSRRVFIESFGNYDDAEEWMSNHLEEHKDWHIVQADLKYINESWRAGLIFEQGQLTFFNTWDEVDGLKKNFHVSLFSKDLDV
jgi:hypothetical protein